MVINHNLSAMNAQTQYNLNISGKNKSVEKLSSGYKINRAADNAAGLAISEKMRSQIRGLDKACGNVQDGSSLVQTADGGLNEVHSLLARQRELLVQAANDTNTESDRAAIEAELTELSKEQDRIYDTTAFNTIDLFKGHDTLIAGPVSKTTVNTTYPVNDTSTNTQNSVQWFDKTAPAPTDTKTNSHQEITRDFVSSYTETETINTQKPDGHHIYDEKNEYITRITKDIYDDTTEVKYQKQPANSQYTNLVKPGTMVGSNGYINVQNEAGDLELSCAMSQLGVQLDGNPLSYSIYDDSAIPKQTTVSPDHTQAETTYDLGNGMQLTQTITLQADQSYAIAYKMTNTDPVNAHTADVRLAFDTMNTQTTAAKNSSPYTLESDFAKIKISGQNETHSAMGDISDLYDTWDDSKVTDGSTVSYHTGAGFWWEGISIPSGQSIPIGQVTYGPITLKKDPYQVTTTTTSIHKQKVTETTTTTTSTILPQYLDIQASAQAYDNIPIRLYDLSTRNLKENVGDKQPVSAFHAADSLKHIDRVIDKISSIRTYYGAMQNRLDSTYNADANTKENTTASESRIRDTDMETEIVRNSRYNILLQAGEAMLSQANQSKQRVLDLLGNI